MSVVPNGGKGESFGGIASARRRMKMIGEPDAGNPPVRFDEGVQETCGTRVAPAPYSTEPPSRK